VDGIVMGIFTEIKPNEKVADKDVIHVKVGGADRQYRRLREGDTVVEGQLLARINDTVAVDKVTVAEAKILVAKAELQTSTATKNEALKRFQQIAAARQKNPGAFSAEEESGAKLTYERYVQEEKAKEAGVVQGQVELQGAQRMLNSYQIHSPVSGIITTIHKQKGEAVKSLETVLEILPQEK
jgi:macrolide-specific efflux system membrane fusion protein